MIMYVCFAVCRQEAVQMDGAIYGGLLDKYVPHVAKHMVSLTVSVYTW